MSSPHTQRNKKKKKNGSVSGEPDFFTVSKKALIGGATAMGASVMLSLVSAALCLLSPDPAALTLPIGLSVFFVSSAIGGAVSAVGFKNRPAIAVVSAVFCGFIFIIVTGICSVWQAVAAPHASHDIPLVFSVILRIFAIPVSALSAYLTSKSAKKRRRTRK